MGSSLVPVQRLGKVLAIMTLIPVDFRFARHMTITIVE